MKKMLLIAAILLAATTFSFAGEGCDHAKATETANAKPHEGCNHDAESGEAACPMKGHEVAESKEVTVEGKLLCRHCNLKETEVCEKVFVPEGASTRYAVCPKSDLKAAEAVSNHGEATIVVTGKLMKAKDGLEVISIKSARAKS